jgi:putative glutamine amidotransferase
MNELNIGVTDCGKFANYEKWLTTEPWVNIVRLGYKQHNFHELRKCNGILLTGGQDVHPRFYNKPEYVDYCRDPDERRDEFELGVLEYAQQHELPVLGICRGLQITNVFCGGTLVPDIESSGSADHTKYDESNDRYHKVRVKENSLLASIVHGKEGMINSAHHQSADNIGHGLTGNASSDDGIVEGLERLQPTGKPFLLLVQWHPERMNDLQSNFSRNVKTNFLEAIRTTLF